MSYIYTLRGIKSTHDRPLLVASDVY